MNKRTLLFIDDDELDRKAFEYYAKQENLPYKYLLAGSVKEAIKIIKSIELDIIVSDYMLGDGTAFDLLKYIQNRVFIIVTSHDNVEIAVNALKAGASDYLIKDIENKHLKILSMTIENALKQKILEKELANYRNHLEELVKEKTRELQKEILLRKNIETELNLERGKLKEYYENLPLLAYNIGLDGKIKDCNQYVVKKLGYQSKNDLIEKPLITTIYAPSSQEKAKKLFKKWKRTGSLVNEEMQIISQQGEIFDVLLNVSTIYKKNGEILSSISTHLDITNEKKLEKQLKQSQRLEAIGQLAGGIAHDFNNILTVINGYSEILMQDMKKSDTKYADLKSILQAGQRASELTKKLLIFSRQQSMEPKIIDLNQLIIDLNKMLRRLISENIQIELRLAKETNYIIADQGQLEQIFINLVVNARDAINQKFNAPKKKKIIIQTGNVYLDDSFSSNNHKSRKGDHVYFSVADNGIGMDEDTKQKIFDPFFTTKKKGEGTGLGLSTVYGIIEQNNAWITADSIKGIGSTFTIYWPHEKSIDQTILTNDNDLDISKGDETILLVEDDQQVRKMTSDALKILGYHVINFSDGLKALHLINNQNMNVDLLITDIVMPNISGQDLAIKFLNIKPASKLLFISGYNDKLNIQHHILKDKLNFINKPFSFHSLAHKVRNVLDMRH